MAKPEEVSTLPTQHISMKMSTFPRDLLRKLIPGNHFPRKCYEEEVNKETEEIELSLGLSLNGRFGVDPIANKLTRSSSIPDFMNLTREKNETVCVVPMMCAPLTRACSLPVETEEWRKRKELQTLRRMEAKRKRTEKQRNFRAAKDRCLGRYRVKMEENWEEDKIVDGKISFPMNGNEQNTKVLNELIPSAIPPFCMPSWVSGKKGGGFNGDGIESKGEMGSGLIGDGCGLERLPPPPPPPSSQGSTGSQGSSSSSISEFESQPVQGMNKCSESRSPACMQSLPDQSEQKLAVNSGTTVEKTCKFSGAAMENPSQKLTVADKGAKEMMINVMADMPCVSTKGVGPNEKRIEGFLYRYRKGEEVRIVCVCHGSFLSPAEFVKHAGGGDVAHPLKHIVVNPSCLL